MRFGIIRTCGLELLREELCGLPSKDQIEWDACHSKNRRALRFPLEEKQARYVVDDTHRIEVLFRARNQSDQSSYRPLLERTRHQVDREAYIDS